MTPKSIEVGPDPEGPSVPEDAEGFSRLHPAVAYLAITLARFDEAMSSLREIVELAVEHVGTTDAVSPRSRAEGAISDLSPERRARVHSAVAQVVSALAGALSSGSDQTLAATTGGHVDERIAKFMIESVNRTRLEAGLSAFAAEHLTDDPELGLSMMAFFRAMFRVPRLPGVLSTMLTVAVSAYEALLSRMCKAWLAQHPEAAGLQDRRIAASLLWGEEDLPELRTRVLTDAVDGWIAAGPQKWPRLLRERCGIDLQQIAVDWPATLEVFLRRNLIVHADGEADRTYLRQLPSPVIAPALGSSLAVDASYLDEALDRLESLGVCTLVAFATKLGPVATQLGWQGIDGLLAVAMAQKRWRFSARVALGALPVCEERDRYWRLRVDAWIARRHLGQSEAVRQEVVTSGLAEAGKQFTLAALILSDDHNAADALTRQLLNEGELTRVDLAQWELFCELRLQPGWLEQFVGQSPSSQT